MFKGKTFLGIIPARGGSKGLPGKNIKELCGKPLIAWSIEAGLKSKYLDEVMVTTDDDRIASVAREYGANVPFLRPDFLANDTATSFDVVKHTIEFYEEELSRKFDYIILLEPTSPLREVSDIDNMIEALIKNREQLDSIISIGEVHEHPSIMKKIQDNNYITSYCKNLEMTSRRQDSDNAYFPYGVAYIVKNECLLKEKTFYTERSTFYIINRYQCYEIDDVYDFLAIENIMKFEWKIK